MVIVVDDTEVLEIISLYSGRRDKRSKKKAQAQTECANVNDIIA
jgi:hypothetical protein